MHRFGNTNDSFAAMTKLTQYNHHNLPILNSKIHNYLALLHYALGELELMLKEFQLGLSFLVGTDKLASNPVISNYALGLSYAKNHEQAEIFFNQAKKLYTESKCEFGYYFYLGTYSSHLENLGLIDEAVEHYQRFIIQSEKSKSAYQILTDIIEFAEFAEFALRHNKIDELLQHIDSATPLAYKCEIPSQISSLANLYQSLAELDCFNDKQKITYYQSAFTFNALFKTLNNKKEKKYLSDIYSLNKSITQSHNNQSLEENLSLISSIGEYLSTNSLTESMLRFNQDLSRFMSADIFAIGLCDPSSTLFNYEYYFENGEKITPPSIDISENTSLAGYCLNTRSAYIHNNFSIEVMAEALHTVDDKLTRYGNNYDFSASVMFAPIIFQDQLLGVLTVQSKRENRYNDYHFNIFKHLTTYLAIGIMHIRQKNALLEQREKFKVLSYTDTVTGLHNRQALFEHFDNLPQQSQISTCGMLVIDIDYFKEYNDFYGHLHGDKLLKKLSHILSETVANTQGMAIRYGGDEFILFMHNCTTDDLTFLGESLLLKLKNAEFMHEKSKISPYITLSIGANSSLLEPSTTIESMFHHADLVLYQAKNKGRNQIVIS